MAKNGKIAKSLEGFVSLLEEPAVVVDQKMNILFVNEGAKDLVSVHINLRTIPEFKSFFSQQASDRSGPSEIILRDNQYDIQIKPLQRKDLLLVTIRERSSVDHAADRESFYRTIGQIVHDMRTPLTAMVGFSRLMAEPDADASQRREYLQKVEHNLEFLESIINDMLFFSKEGSRNVQVDKKVIPAYTYLHNLVSNAEVIVKQSGLKFKGSVSQDIPQTIAIDPKATRHVIENLISNAVKYTQEGTVEVCFDFDHETIELVATVQDTGIGIKQERKDQIFAPFFQENNEANGVGLGLSIVKMVCQQLGGDVRLLESTPNKGSIFEARFSADITGQIGIEDIANFSDPSQAEEDLRGKKILVVDDSPDILLLTKFFLKKTGANIIACGDPFQALELIASEPIDLLISDMQMSGLTGSELLEKAHEAGYQGPAIAVSGLDEDSLKKMDDRFKFSCYLTKPFKFEVMRRLAYELTHQDDSE